MEKKELLDVGDEVQVYGQTFTIKEIVNDYALLEQDGDEYDLVDIELLDIN
jgi:hypothetical protein